MFVVFVGNRKAKLFKDNPRLKLTINKRVWWSNVLQESHWGDPKNNLNENLTLN